MIATFTSGTIGHHGSKVVIAKHSDGHLSFRPELDYEDEYLLGDLEEVAKDYGLDECSPEEALGWLDDILSGLTMDRLRWQS